MPVNIIHFSESDRSAVMPIEQPEVAGMIREQAVSEGFEEVEDFQLTIFPPIRDVSRVSRKEMHAFKSVLQDQHVDDLHVAHDAVYLVNRPKVDHNTIFPRESIIARAHSMKILRVLGARMVTGFGIQVPTPFLYVTMFTRGDNEYARQGIPIASTEEFLKLHPIYYPDQDE